jgi:D-3-phosphoglycerate dehydrogenase
MSKVLVTSRSFGAVTPEGSRLLEEAGFEVQRVPPEERPLTPDKLVRIGVRENPRVVICGAEPLTRAVLAACPDLLMIMKHGVGIDNIDLGAANDQKIVVANAPGTNTEAVADLAIALMLALLRHIVQAVDSTRARAGRAHRRRGRDRPNRSERDPPASGVRFEGARL